MTLESFRTISIPLDTANDSIPPVRLNAGDDEGRVITAIVTDAGRPITDTGLTAGLAWNPRPEDPSSGGASTPMTRGTATLPDGSQTVTFTAPVPRALLAANTGRARLGIEIAGPDGMIVCSRNITAIIEPSVVNATAPEISDPLTDLRNAAETAAKAAADAKQAVSDANAATDEANRVISAASISGGVTTTLPPESPATSTLKGTGLTRTLDLGIPRGAGVTTVEASELDPSLSPRASLDKQSDGDYKLSLALPRAARFRGTSVTTLNPSQEPTAELNMGGSMSGDYDLLLGLPRAARVSSVTATALQSPTATVESDLDGNGDITLRFGIPTGGPGPKGDKGDPGDAGQVATATVAGVVKPGKGLTVGDDGTLNSKVAASEEAGIVKPGEGLLISGDGSGTLSLAAASATTLGGVKPGGGLDVSSDGTLSTRLGAAGIGPGLGLDDHQLLQVNAGKGLQLDDAHGPSTVSVIAGNGLTFNEQNQIVASLPAMILDAPSGRGIVRGFAVFISPQTYVVCVNRLQVVEDAETLSFQLSASNGGILFTGVYDGQQGSASTSMTVTMTNSGTMFDVEFTYDTGTKHWIADRPHVESLDMDCHPFAMLMAWQIQSAKA